MRILLRLPLRERVRSLATTWVAALVLPLAVALAGPAAAQSPGDPTPQIENGSLAPKDTYEFQAAILNNKATRTDGRPASKQDQFFCGGTLISRSWVLTAAHCAESHQASPSNLTVVLGRTKLDITDQETDRGTERVVSEVRVHPQYKPSETSRYADVAMLKLSAPVDDITPIELASGDDDGLESTSSSATALGWGLTAIGQSTSNDLRQATLPISGETWCKDAVDYSFDTYLCAGNTSVNICPGDSGGPLLATATTGKVVQIGISSRGNSQDCTASASGFMEINSIYTKQTDHTSIYDFITQTAGLPGRVAFIPVSPDSQTLAGVQVVNREPTTRASVSLLHGRPGSESFVEGKDVEGGATTTFDLYRPGSPVGSMRVEARGWAARLGVTVNWVRGPDGAPSQQKFAGVDGINGGSTSVDLPLLMRDNDGQGNGGRDTNPNDGISTWLYIQNTEPVDIGGGDPVKLLYKKDGAVLREDRFLLPPYGGVFVNQKDRTDISAEVFSASITSPRRVAVTVMEEDDNSLAAYNGMTDPAATLAAPLIMANNGANTGIQVQNPSNETAVVTVRYSENDAKTQANLPNPCPARFQGKPHARTKTIPAGGFATFVQAPPPSGAPAEVREQFDDQWAGCRYLGAATIESAGGVKIHAIVNQTGAGAYEALDPAGAGPTVTAPLVNVWNGQVDTGFNVQNLGTGTVTVKVKMSSNTQNGGGSCGLQPPAVADKVIGPGKVANLVFGFPSSIPGYVPGYESCTYVGSATFTVEGDPNAKLAAISNQITTGYRDGLAVVSIAGTR